MKSVVMCSNNVQEYDLLRPPEEMYASEIYDPWINNRLKMSYSNSGGVLIALRTYS